MESEEPTIAVLIHQGYYGVYYEFIRVVGQWAVLGRLEREEEGGREGEIKESARNTSNACVPITNFNNALCQSGTILNR